MKALGNIRECTAEPGVNAEEPLKKDMEAKSHKFTGKGSEIYAKA